MSRQRIYLLFIALFTLAFMLLVLLGGYLLTVGSKAFAVASFLFAFGALFGQIGSLALYSICGTNPYTPPHPHHKGTAMAEKPEKIVLASGNAGKLKEFGNLFEPHGITVLPQSEFGIPECPEPYSTFVENALAKARHAAKYSGLPALADDSGICAAALNGAPGIHSARYAGDNPKSDSANNLKLAGELACKADKSCSYVCVLVFIRHENDPRPIIAEGVWHGQWHDAPQGQNGFGYDPYFYLPGHCKTAAELDSEVKNRESHRAQALAELLRKLAL